MAEDPDPGNRPPHGGAGLSELSAGRGPSGLRELARLYGVQSSYRDVTGRRKVASQTCMVAALSALGAPVSGPENVVDALRSRREQLWRRLCEPVAIAWDRRASKLRLRIPARIQDARLECRLELEDGEVRTWPVHVGELPPSEKAEVEGVAYVAKAALVPQGLPYGYHRLTLSGAGAEATALLISAPRKAWEQPARAWGAFLPLYALRSETSWGIGDFSDLDALVEWVRDLGGSLVASLPFFAAFLDEPFDPSPYSPASRLFWNELYVDVEGAPGIEGCPEAQSLLASANLRTEIDAVRRMGRVDYRRVISIKRPVLEALSRSIVAGPSGRGAAFDSFLASDPAVADYALFRSACERYRTPWPQWPQPQRDGRLQGSDGDEDARLYHLYVQWLAHEQLEAAATRAREGGGGLYLDFPVGVHPAGYDVWREREAFVPGASAGAPPDAVFTRGQVWGFPPMHPEGVRDQGYRYLIECFRRLLRHARVLRIDHVMSLHRLWTIPNGLEASEGVYVRYRAEELYAVLALESHRAKSVIVGEDLGTVPDYVGKAMDRHRLHHTYVTEYELAATRRPLLPPIKANSAASVNTHDMPTFTAFWEGSDIEDRLALGLLDSDGARKERQDRRTLKQGLVGFLEDRGWPAESGAAARPPLKGCLAHLASSDAAAVVVNLEDIWGETEPQNVPGTGQERPNWQRKARHSLEGFRRMPEVVETLRDIDRLRGKD